MGRVTTHAAANSRSNTATLTAGQSRAVKHILTSKDRVTLIRGAAGVGKTTSLQIAAEGIRSAGLSLRAIAPTSKAAEELRAVDPHSGTLARFLIDQKMQESARDGVVIVDEASLLGTRQASELFGVLEKINARAVLVGDVKQHTADRFSDHFSGVRRRYWARS
ncbi:AAA family ATPase [Gemmata massiliana]|uniref:AAA family ATPase n=1 Tax=Gemmata massiliana TaxID=1210884 RepID=UPI0013A68A1C|nr:AAA family ATPase [Gemmata massiliana]